MYLLCMIKARIRWCTCRVENILTLGKLLSLWFCFLLHSILFLISQTSYLTYKIISSYELARPVMGTIFLVTCFFVQFGYNFTRKWLNCTRLRLVKLPRHLLVELYPYYTQKHVITYTYSMEFIPWLSYFFP